MKKYLMEFIGTFFLVLAIALSGNPIAIGLMLAMMVYLGGHVSGGHYNPAVTLMMGFRGEMKPLEVFGYIFFQVFGGFCAASISFIVTGYYFLPQPEANILLWKALIIEALFTFVLCSVVYTVAKGSAFKGSFIYGFAIGLTLTAIIFAGGHLSGGCYNHAVAFGPMIFSWMKQHMFSVNYPLYLVGPFLGSIFAAMFTKYMEE
jgi:aquaporin Z